MRIFGLRTRVVEVVSGVLVLSMFAGCVVEEKKRNKHDDDCDSDLDCDEDEICDDGECEKQTSGSGGSSSNPGSGGSSSNPSGGSAGSSPSTPSSDVDWCRPRCEDSIQLCAAVTSQADCENACASSLASARAAGCEASYKLYIDCGLDTGSCDQVTIDALCSEEYDAVVACAEGSAAQ